MASKLPVALTPIGVRGMKVLNRQKFLRNVEVPILKLCDENLSKVTAICKQYFMKLENFRPVQTCDNLDKDLHKVIYLNPEKVIKWTDIANTDRKLLDTFGVTEKNFDSKVIQIGYDNFKHDLVFKAVLPEHEEIVSGFSQIGHIIHLNLRDHLLDYQSLIGNVLIDKIKTCRTVINKSTIIDNTYRNFKMEVIAGDEDFIVTVKESRCYFTFDFSKVYWNSRLAKEHERILEFLKPGDILFDIFCGVGPFSIPAAKRKCEVFANDLNPDSFKWLNHNAKKNKVSMSLFKSFNLDGKDFICTVFKDYIIELCKKDYKQEKNVKIHVTMNLPALAVQFLKYFNGLIVDDLLAEKFNCEIIVYVYCFVVGDNQHDDAKQLVIENVGCDISRDILDVFNVRNVAPKKEMMRVTFKLNKNIIFGLATNSDHIEPPPKKICV